MGDVDEEVRLMKQNIDNTLTKKRERLKNLDFFLLDNSIRESTVGQLRSHTLQNKIDIYEQIKKCGIKHAIIATFGNLTRVDDDFVQYLIDKGEDFENFYAFSEVGVIKNGAYDHEAIPVGMKKNKQYKIRHTVFEIDFANKDVHWGEKFTIKDMCNFVRKQMKWVRENIYKDARIVINMRDMPVAMLSHPERIIAFVKFLSELPPEEKLFALTFEDPLGESVQDELEAWTASIRKTMEKNGWLNGLLLVHIHEKWDLKTAAQLSCLSAGADGVWTSLCEEGASCGHACASVTMMNLIRMGNKKILEKFNCVQLRNAARAITEITTGKPPPPKQPVYGDRAMDLVFGDWGVGSFDLAKFFNVETPQRMTTLASTKMIVTALTRFFGENPQFNEEIAFKMKETMLQDLRHGRKEEYMSRVGLAILFDRSGGKLTEAMSDEIAKVELKREHHKVLIDEIRKEWDEWDRRDEIKGDDCLEFDNFYHGFLAPYFSCYRCTVTKKAFQAIDMDSDGLVDWKEFCLYLKWALNQYPETATADELLTITFEKGIIPAIHDEVLQK